ncbi:MAG TPA: DEAD/DEAH box helicase [Actinomycetes bacterium]|nr:DEAD/DEAH box helicase [Actinomycetes bacterium]
MADPSSLIEELTSDPDYRGQLVHVERLPARRARRVELPDDLPDVVRSRLEAREIETLWSHQAEAIALARSGTHVIVSTGTASGKSLCYQLPVFEALLGQGHRTALYLAPTKALAHDQLRAVRSFALTGVRAASYDGDTPAEERPRVRRNANLVLTNPDMLHQGILPGHERWSAFLGQLSVVVVDEAHTLRGVFGSHVAAVLRRLRRLANRYGADPTFVLASATLGNPAELASKLIGLPVEAVTADGSPRGRVTFALWEPPVLDETTGLRRSANVDASNWLAAGVEAGVRTLCFTRSRKAAELVATYTRRRVAEVDRSLAGRVRAYRAGYLAEERRALEAGIVSGRLLGVAATNALELGMDIGGLDAIVLDGFPGTIASLWQQAGRAGRQGGASLAVLVGLDDPLDAYYLHHPADLFGRPHEAALVDPGNPYVLAPHLACAAYEAPLTEEDLDLFGPPSSELVASLENEGVLRRGRGGYRASSGRSAAAAVDLRNAGGAPVTIVEAATGQVIGTVDRSRAPSTVHQGAVYLHQGESYRVMELDLDAGAALVETARGGEYTQARRDTDVQIVEPLRRQQLPRSARWLGRVAVTEQVVGYQRRKVGTGELLGYEDLDLPPSHLSTIAYWYTLTPELLEAAALETRNVPGAAHAAEHAQIGLLPLFAMCDRWDIGGLSTAWHPETGMATIFVYDGYPGGAGITERGYALAAEHLHATRDTIRSCPCETGCPSCVQSPKCGNGNHPLDKSGAIRLLDQLLIDLDAPLPGAPSPTSPALASPVSPEASRNGPAGAAEAGRGAVEGGSAGRRPRRSSGRRGGA